jgi:hypothetical protein
MSACNTTEILYQGMEAVNPHPPGRKKPRMSRIADPASKPSPRHFSLYLSVEIG